EPAVWIGQDVRGRHRATVEDGSTDGPAAGRNGSPAGILGAQPSDRPEDAELTTFAVPGRHDRRLGGHHLRSLVRDGVEHFVEVERRGERAADRFHRTGEDGATPPFRRIGEECPYTGNVTASITEPDAPRLDADRRAPVGARYLGAEAALASHGVAQMPRQADRIEEREQVIHGTPDRRRAR